MRFTTRLARTGAFLTIPIVGWLWIAPLQAGAQLGGLPLPPPPPPPSDQGLIVDITSPASGSTLGGTVPFSASVNIIGSLTVSRVEFYVDGALVGTDSTPPYSVGWNTRTVGNGSHTLRATAVAVDLLGLAVRDSDSVTVAVFNDKTAPAVAVTSPSAAALVRGSIPVTASASDNVGVTRVDFFVGTTPIGSDTTSPWGVSWDTTKVADGARTLTARASDAAGNTGTSAGVTVTVDNTRPAVSIDQAAGQADPTGDSPITFTAVFSEDVTGFTADEVTIGGTAGGTPAVAISGGPGAYTVEVSGMTDGTVVATIAAGVASDAAGNVNTASTSSDNTVTFATAGESTASRFEERAAAYQGNWTLASDTDTGVTSSNGAVAGSAAAGATATFTFTGTGVRWIGFPCEVCGIANVYLEAGTTPGTTPVATVDTYAATRPATTGPLWTSSPLEPGTYTFRIEVTGTSNAAAGGAFVILDGFDVTGSGTTTPVAHLEETAVTFAGSWSPFSDAQTGVTSTNGTVGGSNTAGSTATLTFTGTSITWVGFTCELCGMANVYLEAGTTPGTTTPVATIDTYAATRPASTGALWTSGPLASGTYTVRIEVAGTKNAASSGFFSIVDAFEMTGDAIAAGVASNANTTSTSTDNSE